MFVNHLLENHSDHAGADMTSLGGHAWVHEQIDAQAARTPDRLAVSFGEQALTYRELSERSTQLAAVLRQRGIARNELVAVLADRSLEMVVGLLGVLKAGAAYVPLDPSHPPERLAYMVQDSDARIVLTRKAEREQVASLLGDVLQTVSLLLIDDLPAIPDAPLEPVALGGDNLAYVIYTSGSTGKPKGVMVQHSALANFLRSMAQRPGLDASDVLLAITTISFDIAGLELWLPLTQGARCHLTDRATVRDVERLMHCIAQVKPTIMQATPALWTMLFLAGWRNAEGLRALCGGEAMPSSLKQRFVETGTQAWNMYGPTETTVWSAIDQVHPDRSVCLGEPIAETSLHVLDQDLRPVADGGEGELCIAGAGVAMGYWKRPELTAQQFIQHPLAPNGRMYRTNDLVRLGPNGALEYLGRLDFQVKIRGYRVELGEVEALLMQHPSVLNAVVLTQQEQAGGNRLLAYVIASAQALQHQSEAGLLDHLHRHMQNKAPDYMRPAVITVLPHFPLTTSGKIDRRALPAIDQLAYSGLDFEPPRTAPEQMLVEVWGEQLGITGIGRNANFFNLGGHSLQIVNVMLALRRRGVMVEMHALYKYPLLSELALQLPEPTAQMVGAPALPQASGALTALDPAALAVLAESVPGGLANIEAAGPLGPMQQGMLFHLLAHPEGDPFVLWQVVRFAREDLLHAWLDALRATIARHAALRVGIVHQGLAQALQVVWRTAPLVVETLSGPDGVRELQQRAHAPHKDFDLAQAPLQRCSWCHDPQSGQWVLLHQMHHLAMDHATEELIQQEVDQRLLGRPLAEAPPLAIFAALAEPEPDRARRQAAHKAYFDAMLGGYEPIPAPLGASQVLAGDAVVVQAQRRLPAALAGGIRQQARAHGVTVAAIFHLAWAKVLTGLGGRDDVVFNTVLLGRLQLGEAAQTAPGLFINTLPIRLQLGQHSVLDCLWRTQDALTQLIEHEQAQLALAQKSAQLPGNTPLATALLNFRHSGIERMLSAEPFCADTPSAVPGISYSGVNDRTPYPLALNVDDLGDDFVLNAQVEQGQDAQRIGDWVESALQSIADALATAPGKVAGRLIAMPAAEREQILHGWNLTEAAFPAQACLHELIEAQAQRTPEAVALEFGESRLSYGELNREANQLARHLVQAYGAGPDSLVGVCAERSLEMVIALLAVLKAGAAYVPLDPHYPDERLDYMLRDAATVVVLSHAAIPAGAASVLGSYSAQTGARVLDLETGRAHWSGLDASDLPRSASGASPDQLAYVIYTSGSTGHPKGVMNAHRGVVNRLVWMQKAYGLTSADAVLQKTPFSFDVSVWEFFWPLMYGARLVVARPEGHKDPAYLSETIAARGITTLHFVPSMLSAFLDHATVQADTRLRQVFCSGEALPAASVRRFFERFPTVELHNLYGPTEAAIDVTAWDCRHAAPTGVVPIGCPIDNIRIHILDGWGEPCPIGVAGELHIAGVGVARGYLGRAKLTAEKFIADPFHPDGGSMYRSGDLARYLPGGAIEYLGRNDFQVKLRGFRIELGEIEAALQSHPAVKECLVLLRQDLGDARLVAYLTPAAAETASEQSLREHLLLSLPAFMVPGNLVWLDAFPVTANGKLDRKALPSPHAMANPDASAATLAEGTQTRLAEVWAQLIGHNAIGPQTHFYEAGGHSLLAVALMAGIGQAFGVNLSLSAIVAHSELAAQAALIDAELARGETAVAAAGPAGDGRIRALPVQKAIFKAIRLDPHDLSNNSYLALAFEAEPDQKVLRNVLQAVFARHEGLRARFVLDNDEVYLQPAPRFLFRLEKRQTLGSLEQDLRDFVQPFSLDDGINVRGRWIGDAAQPLLLLNISHAVIDGSGMTQLLEELASGDTEAPAEASLSAYSSAFHGARFAGLRHGHADYWQARLQGWQAATPPAAAAARNGSWQFSLDGMQKAQIDALASSLRISLSEFFMALFLNLKARLEQSPDQLTSMIFHGRDELAQQAVLAPLMAVLPVRAAVPMSGLSAADIGNISLAVREACRHYLFDAEALAARCPELAHDALFAPAFFGYFQRAGFAGHIAGQACRQLETPAIGGAQAHWKLTCEIAEHAGGFDIRLEALGYRATDGNADWEALFRSLLEEALAINIRTTEAGTPSYA
ncbi:amino acid adenylation domain-containing protein [Chitinimonas arctica]|uniref:Amino acid adenylation domain-containing protein n=1 Tax=Chitinimonas arctica TaxID=2594795 RepID=A0A516SKQ6_9NEIS|nr:non-ribosomal peptide synthetase [Chitinimonas arctica]QDQ28740.1 amino acid adenylation domain-containing protein [Chitinimonas arctica]